MEEKSSENIKKNKDSETDGPTECDCPSTSSIFSEEPPRKIVKVSSPSCKAVNATKLYEAVRKNNLYSVCYILMHDQKLVNVGDSLNLTALHIAAWSGYKEIVHLLITAGANTRIQYPTSYETPLHLALRWNKVDAAEALVDWDLNKAPNDLKDSCGRTPLYWAAYQGYTEVVKKLVAKGANAHLSDPVGHTPLHVAILHNEERAVDVLVDCGTVHDLRNIIGRSPLHLAACEGNVKICKKLIDAGCNARLQDNDDASPIHLALQKGNDAAALALLGLDKVNNIQDADGMTPLHHASLHGCIRIVRKLLSTCANRHLRDKEGRTPLHMALHSENEQIAEILIDSGAVSDIEDRVQPPLLHLPVMKQWENVVRKLLFCDVHPHIKDDEGVYPLETALIYRNEEIPKMILSACSLKGIKFNWEELELEPHEVRSCIEQLSTYDIETQRMKSTMVPGTKISYHDLAKGSVNTLARYLNNELVQQFLTSGYAMEDCPNYAELITFKMRKAKSRKILTDQCLENFVPLSGKLHSLPTLCINKILTHLSHQDLQSCVEAFKVTP